jgi:hypothetical protein
MTFREPSNPSRPASLPPSTTATGTLLATLTTDATLTNDGNPRPLRDRIDREIFCAAT